MKKILDLAAKFEKIAVEKPDWWTQEMEEEEQERQGVASWQQTEEDVEQELGPEAEKGVEELGPRSSPFIVIDSTLFSIVERLIESYIKAKGIRSGLPYTALEEIKEILEGIKAGKIGIKFLPRL